MHFGAGLLFSPVYLIFNLMISKIRKKKSAVQHSRLQNARTSPVLNRNRTERRKTLLRCEPLA